MNKKITIIELFVKIANEEEMPKKLKFDNTIWIYNRDRYDYIDTGDDIKLFAELIVFSKGWLNQEVEILEDNTEEIEELRIDNITTDERLKINELVRCVNQMRKERK